MKASLALFLIAAVALVKASTDRWTEMRVKFAPNGDGVDVDSFWLVRPTLHEALADGWVRVNIKNRLGLRAVGISCKDLGVNPLYDDNGFLAGVHVAQPADDVFDTKPPFYDPFRGSTNKLKTINGVQQLTSYFLLVDPEVLAAGGRTELGGSLAQGLWLRDTESESGFWQVPTYLSELNTTTLYNWQNCIPAMGLHFYYNLHRNVGDCSDIYPWFLTGYAGSVSGIGYQILSKKTIYDRDWYDNITGPRTKLTRPNAPKCLAEYADSHGVTSIHIYFINEPWTIKCNQATDSVEPIPDEMFALQSTL